MASISQIQDFLNEISKADSIDIVPTAKNKQTRLAIGLTTYDQIDIIKNLAVKDYKKGPKPDEDPTKKGDVWMFTYTYDGNLLYIKLKIISITNKESKKTIVKCLSVHLDSMF